MKFLLWGLIVAAIVLWVLRAKKTVSSIQQQQRKSAEAGPADVEVMLQCAHCGIHLPQSEAVLNPTGEPYCSVEHRRLHNGA